MNAWSNSLDLMLFLPLAAVVGPSGRPTRMAPFGWAVCLKCLAALRDD
jgi:hypothetical protein